MARQQLSKRAFTYLTYMNNISNQKKNKGFSLIEVIVYFSILTVISVLVVGNIFSLFKSYNTVRANQEIEYNAINILDKLTRDTRDAAFVNTSDSSFSVAQGAVSLNIASTTDSTASNTAKFYLTGGKLKYKKDGVDFGNLSTNNVTVSNFKIYYISATSTEAIKVELGIDITPHLNSTTITKNFYTTIQLRE